MYLVQKPIHLKLLNTKNTTCDIKKNNADFILPSKPHCQKKINPVFVYMTQNTSLV